MWEDRKASEMRIYEELDQELVAKIWEHMGFNSTLYEKYMGFEWSGEMGYKLSLPHFVPGVFSVFHIVDFD